MQISRVRCTLTGLAILTCIQIAGCPGGGIDVLLDIENEFSSSVDQIQVVDPRGVALPSDARSRGDTVVLASDVVVVTSIQEDLLVEELPNVTLIGFENLTGFDAYFEYFVEDDLQAIFVFDGETLLLEYDCLADLELVLEEHYDQFDGEFVEAFDYNGALFLNPEDFICGEALIFTFDPFTVDIAINDTIDLTR